MNLRRLLPGLAAPLIAVAVMLGGPLPAVHAEEPPISAAEDDQSSPGAPNIALGSGEIPAGRSGESVRVVVPIVNRGDGAATNVLVSPKISAEAANFPFEITRTDYTRVVEGEFKPGDGQIDVDLGEFKLRGGLTSGYYSLPLAIQYNDGAGTQVLEKTIFINVDGVAAPDPQAPQPVTQAPQVTIEIPGSAAGGGYQPAGVSDPGSSGSQGGGYGNPGGGGDSAGGGGGASGSTGGYTPRVMLTSFTTDPAQVEAGQNFVLTFTVQNMSSTLGVGNVKVTVATPDASFLPVAGASSVYIDAIAAGEQVTRELQFRALPGLEERPYQLSLQIEYEDSVNFAPLAAQETIAVVAWQKQRAETGTIDVLPESVSVGQEASVSFAVQNQGKNRLYNTRVTVPSGQAISAQDFFVGNVEPGTQGLVDLMVSADRPTTKPVKIQISYEDAAGVVNTIDRELKLTVTEESSEPSGNPADQMAPVGNTMLPLMIGALVVVTAIVLGAVLIQRRKQKRQAELAANLDSLDADPIVPTDPQ